MTAAQTRLAPVIQQTQLRHRPAKISAASAGSPVPAPGANLIGSTNWSGFAIEDPTNPFATASVQAELVTPVAQQAFGSCSGQWDYSAQWIGVDGFNSNDVMQAGVEADARCASGRTSASYSAWFEWYPNYSYAITNLPISRGDIVYVQVWNTSPTQAHVYIVDYTTQRSASIAFAAPKGTSLTGDSIECVVERPEVSGAIATLTNYVADPFTSCGATASGKSFSPGSSPSGSVYDIEMVDNSGNLLSYANLVGPTALWFYDAGSSY
jgi:hypothetical protein